MEHSSLAGRIFRGVALTLILIFFMFPIVWIFLMSFQNNDQILRIPPRILFEPTLANYEALISGQLRTAAGNLQISFMRNLFNSVVLSSAAVLLASTLATALTCSGSAPGQTCAVAAAVTDFGAKSAPGACCTCAGSSCFDSGF